MKTTKKILTLVLLLACAVTQSLANSAVCCLTPVEVTELKNLGISDSDETKSVIEVKWQINPSLHPNHSDFNVSLEITYADGTVLIIDEQSENVTRSLCLEVPSVHLRRGKAPAYIKQIKAFVTTEVFEKKGEIK